MSKAVAVVLAAVAFAACLSSVQCKGEGDPLNTLQDPRNQQLGCIDRYYRILNTYYTNDTQCQQLITAAMNTTVPNQCPPGGTAPGSAVHLCMNKNGTTAVINEWTNFMRACEVMYIAFRTGPGESEEGFVALDNSCFRRFDSYAAFLNYMNDASPYKYTGAPTPSSSTPSSSKGSNAAGLTSTVLSSVLGAVALALMLILA